MDAVAVSDLRAKAGAVQYFYSPNLYRKEAGAHAAVLPRGPVVYVAGDAAKGATLADMARNTVESLRATLKWMDLSDGNIVQMKAFLNPVQKTDEVREAFAAAFGDHTVPPLVFVEWTDANSIEIELIAAAPRLEKTAEVNIDYLTPPAMIASPIFSRAARINQGKRVYVSGLYGSGNEAAAQVKDIFAQLDSLVKRGGGDLKHLAKATYYVATDDASKQLNELRPNYYDPKRPPAASKARVRGTGVEGRGLTIDMIAVQIPQRIKSPAKAKRQ
jgi:enamine deaminase RidA (YjgF/YER057c/UK114 family)